MLALVAFALPVAGTARAGQRDGTRQALLNELNRVRANAHLAGLHLDRKMNEAAAAYTSHLARMRRIGHGTWSARVAQSASAPAASGEVIGWLSTGSARAEAAAIVQTWLDSPVHRNVLLDGDFRRIGIGRAVGLIGGARSAIYTVDFASAR